MAQVIATHNAGIKGRVLLARYQDKWATIIVDRNCGTAWELLPTYKQAVTLYKMACNWL